MPKFNNRENERIALPDGRVIFLARSTAVVACIMCIHNDETFVLMVERGPKLDQSGRWCMPCGYLDWDETLQDAVKREVFEETAFDLDMVPVSKLIHSGLDQPYHIGSSPTSNRQNISHHFGIVFQGPLPVLPKSEALVSGELGSVEWVKLSTIPTKDALESSGLKDYFAFDHNEDIHHFIDHLHRKEGLDLWSHDSATATDTRPYRMKQ